VTLPQHQLKAFHYANNLDDAPQYQHSAIGYNYRMSNICAGIGRGQMEVLNSHVKNAEPCMIYADLFQNYDGISVLQCPMPIF
jgi:dTDP-4-amino-4,6-dideoxygalactose transaminase